MSIRRMVTPAKLDRTAPRHPDAITPTVGLANILQRSEMAWVSVDTATANGDAFIVVLRVP